LIDYLDLWGKFMKIICKKVLVFLFPLLLFKFAFVLSAVPQFNYVFCHGLGGDQNQVGYYHGFGIIPTKVSDERIFSENGPEVGNLGLSDLAQQRDIDVLVGQIRQISSDESDIIGVAVSKGAATWINAVGQLASSEEGQQEIRKIRALVLESPFADAIDIAHSFAQRPLFYMGLSGDNSVYRWAEKTALTSIYPNYDPEGISPIKSVKELWGNVDRNLIIVFIHSKQDGLIPVNHSRQLYLELKKLGFENLYLIETEYGQHANVFWDGKNRNEPFEMLCYIYDHHDLPVFDDYRAPSNQGELLAGMQPSIETVQKRIKDSECCSLPRWLARKTFSSLRRFARMVCG